jgi:hypothetical protein
MGCGQQDQHHGERGHESPKYFLPQEDHPTFWSGVVGFDFGRDFLYRGLNQFAHLRDGGRILVRIPPPDEKFGEQPVVSPAGCNVNMQVWDTLTDAGVYGDKRTVGFQCLLDGASQQLHICEKGPDAFRGEIFQQLEMVFGNEKTMPAQQGTMIQKGEGYMVFKHPMTGCFTPDDFAKRTILTGQIGLINLFH